MFYQARIDLFTKFSHELRTPLMLIQGPIEEVMETNDPSKMDMSSFKMVHNNLNRLRMLIDQLLTFRQKESGSLKINVSAGDFNGFAREIRLAFNELAGIHDIDFRLEEGKIPKVWKKSKTVLLFKKGSKEEMKNFRPICLLSHVYKCFTRIILNRISADIDYHAGREQAGFRSGFSTIGHIHVINQLTEKCQEYKLPLCYALVEFK